MSDGALKSHNATLYFLGKACYPLPMKSTISSKGQVTVPVEVRDKLGLSPGTEVQFELRRNGVLLRKGGGARHAVDRVFGLIELPLPVDETITEMRGLAHPKTAPGTRKNR